MITLIDLIGYAAGLSVKNVCRLLSD